MNARAFLIRGLLAGLAAGLLTFLVAYAVGEPQVATAISLEEAGSAAPADPGAQPHDDGDAPAHTHADAAGAEAEGTEVSRANQSTWGLLTGTLAVGLALGGLVGLSVAGAAGRIGRLGLGATTALVTSIGFVAIALVPFLKYPATPPAVGNGETIGQRTALYFGFLLLSVVAAIAISVMATKLAPRVGTYAAVVGGVGSYLVIMIAAGLIFPTVNEVGDFPADTLWFFRRASLITLTALWAGIGVVLAGLLLRLQRDHVATESSRELANSL